MYATQTTDEQRDLPLIRVYELENKNKVRLQREDPFGFWYFSMEAGQLPEVLKGAYTNADVAEVALKTYLINKDRKIISQTKV